MHCIKEIVNEALLNFFTNTRRKLFFRCMKKLCDRNDKFLEISGLSQKIKVSLIPLTFCKFFSCILNLENITMGISFNNRTFIQKFNTQVCKLKEFAQTWLANKTDYLYIKIVVSERE